MSPFSSPFLERKGAKELRSRSFHAAHPTLAPSDGGWALAEKSEKKQENKNFYICSWDTALIRFLNQKIRFIVGQNPVFIMDSRRD
jgi:hypothetical protein